MDFHMHLACGLFSSPKHSCLPDDPLPLVFSPKTRVILFPTSVLPIRAFSSLGPRRFFLLRPKNSSGILCIFASFLLRPAKTPVPAGFT